MLTLPPNLFLPLSSYFVTSHLRHNYLSSRINYICLQHYL